MTNCHRRDGLVLELSAEEARAVADDLVAAAVGLGRLAFALDGIEARRETLRLRIRLLALVCDIEGKR